MSGWLKKSLKKILDADIDFLVDELRLALIDVADVTQAKSISAATNATPISVTATSHGLTTGDEVTIFGVTGNTNANGHRKVTVTDANNFTLQDPRDGTNIAGNGTFGGTAFVISLEVIEFLGDLAAASIVARTAALASKTTARGVLDCADPVFSAVTGDQSELMVLYQHTGTDASSEALAIIDSFTSGMPVTPNGGDINTTIAAAGLAAIG